MISLGMGRLEEILARANDLRVVVIGDVMLDIYLTGSVQRISPEAPVPVVQVVEERTALGGAANVVANVVRIGAECEIIGLVGEDAPGAMLRRSLETLEGGRVLARLISSPERPTTTKTRVMARHQQVVRFDRERDDDADSDLSARVCEAVRAAISLADVVILEDYNKGVLSVEVIRTAIHEARRVGVPVVVDPKFRNIFEYSGATVFKPNSLELTSALGVPIRADDDEWLRQARERLCCEHLLVTLGEQGMVVASPRKEVFRVPAIAREVYDVSGAGDTVVAFVAVALAAGADMREATILAHYAAAIEVGKHGVSTVTPEELRDLIKRYDEIEV